MNELPTDLNLRFDHAALHSEYSEKEIVQLCKEAGEHNFYSVAVNPIWTSLAKAQLQETVVKVLTVSGFPLGASRTDVKVIEAVRGVSDGAVEIDMVANIGWFATNQFAKAEQEIKIIRENLPFNVLLKVIIEAGKLSQTQQQDATKCVINGGAQFVKTCTGFFGGATVEQVKVLSEVAGTQIEVKASGGIKTLEQCCKLLDAGATRLGSSSSVAIMTELRKQLQDKR